MRVITLRDNVPLAREDGVPFVTAELQEAASSAGPFATIESFALDPVDPDPSAPLARDFTSNMAALEAGWYRVRWVDGADDEYVSAASYSDSRVPTAADVRDWAPPQYDWTEVGFPPPEPGAGDRLERRVDWAVSYVEQMTGREFVSMPDPLLPLAEQATVLRTMQQASGGGAKALRIAEQPWLKSFTAGSYSETRFSPSELGGNSREVLLKINPWLELAQLLWLLMTEAKRDEWLAIFAGRVKPAGAFFPLDMGADLTGVGRSIEPYDESGLID